MGPDSLSAHADTFPALVAGWAAEQADIRMVLLLGSRARTIEPADRWSDFDLVIATADPARYLNDEAWVAAFGEPLLTFVEETATGGERERRVLYASGLDVDFSIFPMETVMGWATPALPPVVADVLARGMRVLVDKDGLEPALREHVPSGYPRFGLPGAAAFTEARADFLYHCLWAARKLARGETAVALASVGNRIRLRLLDMIRWRTIAVHGHDPGVWYGARKIERWAGDDILAGFASTTARYDATEIWAALDASMDLLADLSGEVARAIGIVVDDEVERRVRQLIDDCRPSPPP